jgi:hypothetical protein
MDEMIRAMGFDPDDPRAYRRTITPGREPWETRFETRVAEELTGDEWPVIMVERWEENALGERRLVATRMYVGIEKIALDKPAQ